MWIILFVIFDFFFSLFFFFFFYFFFFFFFSSRRRHTRLVSDWSSDVCFRSLLLDTALAILHRLEEGRPAEPPEQREQDPEDHDGPEDQPRVDGEGRELPFLDQQQRQHLERSEERRVGKECRSGWSPYHKRRR